MIYSLYLETGCTTTSFPGNPVQIKCHPPAHPRMLVQSISMTGSDLVSSAKPWDAQVSTATVIYDEFYEQVRK